MSAPHIEAALSDALIALGDEVVALVEKRLPELARMQPGAVKPATLAVLRMTLAGRVAGELIAISSIEARPADPLGLARRTIEPHAATTVGWAEIGVETRTAISEVSRQ